jgi:putative ABC transport system permease protein
MGLEDGIPKIADYISVQTEIDVRDEIEASLPVLSGMATVSVDETTVGFSMLWGVDFAKYRSMFPDSIELVEGDWPIDVGANIMLTDAVRFQVAMESKREIKPGDKILLNGMGPNSGKIREVTVAGIIQFKTGGEMLNRISLVDPVSVRKLNGITAEVEPMTTGSASISQSTVDEESLFSSESFTTEARLIDRSQASLDTILGDTSTRDKYNVTDNDSWHYILIRLKDPKSAEPVRQALIGWLASRDLELSVDSWRWGAGTMAELAFNIQLVFNGIVIVIVFVIIIIIMNTLVISITERIPEIGTMRAIGTQKNFVRLMIYCETLIISLLFGAVGMMLGCLMIGVLHWVGISAGDPFLETLVGGTMFYPSVSLSALVTALLATVLIGIGSCLYPIAMALKITPIRAMQR